MERDGHATQPEEAQVYPVPEEGLSLIEAAYSPATSALKVGLWGDFEDDCGRGTTTMGGEVYRRDLNQGSFASSEATEMYRRTTELVYTKLITMLTLS